MKELLLLSEEKRDNILGYMPKESTVSRLADFFGIFADATRIKILTVLCVSDMCVNDISVILNLNQTTVSHQLKQLKMSGAVTSTRHGKIAYYKIANQSINDIMLDGVDYLLAN